MLLYALSDVLNLEKIVEPFNKNLWDNADNFPNLPDKPNYQSGDIPNNTITKVITNQNIFGNKPEYKAYSGISGLF